MHDVVRVIAKPNPQILSQPNPLLKPHYLVTRPNGTAWQRTFATTAAAWRVVVPGRNSAAEWRAKRAAMEREGRRVAPGKAADEAAQS